MKLSIQIDVEDNEPILESTLIELAKKHHAILLGGFESGPSDVPRGTWLPSSIYFALDEDEAQWIEERWAHGGHVRRIYQP